MADDKATTEAINNLTSMFPDIDKETITDIFLGCKKDFDGTVDQLLGMGASMGNKPASPPKSPVLEKPAPVPVSTAPPLSPQLVENKVPKDILDTSAQERERVELLNQQLVLEYRRLAETQEKNMMMEKQLATVRANIDEERRKLEDDKIAFQANKKQLEEHLSGRLKEMKDELRRKEEQNRQDDEERRRHFEAMQAEERQLREEEEQRRSEEKTSKKEEKRKREANNAEETRVLLDELQQAKERYCALEHAYQTERAALHERVIALEQALADNNHSGKDSVVAAMRYMQQWLGKGLEDFQQKDVRPELLTEELLRSLHDTHL
jgi:hypothetical protein